MEREYNCPVTVGQPKVQFRECITEPEPYEYEHKKQSGGRGQYGKAKGIIRPHPDDMMGIGWKDTTTGTNLPKNFIKPLFQGMEEMIKKGPQIGAPMVGLEIEVNDGKIHPWVHLKKLSNTELYF